MPRMGFEPTIPVFERAKVVHAFDSAATVIGFSTSSPGIIDLLSIELGKVSHRFACFQRGFVVHEAEYFYLPFSLRQMKISFVL
jgi:hypothetical protein